MTTTVGRTGTEAGSEDLRPPKDSGEKPQVTGSGAQDDDEFPVVTDRTRQRLHLLAVSVALTVLTFVQAPGKIAPDTKADLNIDPVGFLLRAWHLWEPLGDSGQLQNQAYGYFLPMGPFFAAGHVLGLPPWIVQRIWWSLVFLVAFHGGYRLCRRFGVGTHSIAIIAALAFALSPRMITEMGAVSIEVWPMAVAPWVLLPLIRVVPGGEATAAARSGLALALCGGVNAVAVGAVLPLPIWWLITRERSRMRRTLTRWWIAAVFLATFWWVGPLLLLGRYSPPFLDWVESSAVSTSKANLPAAFRGTTQWVAWFKLPQPIWLAGWSVLSSPAGILLSWLLIGVALVGILRRDCPNRVFLLGGIMGGLALLTVGHVGPLTPPWAHPVQSFLDHAGAPLRNTHKFDILVRIPLMLGLAHALTVLRVPHLRGLPKRGKPLVIVASLAVLGSAAPALVGQLPSRGSYAGVPDYWKQAAEYLKRTDDGNRTLIVPGSEFATSTWGDPHDEPFQALARTKWATRSGVPLSSAGNIRMLTEIEQQLETGRGSPGLAEYLARAGISRLLVRDDLARQFIAGSPPLPVIVHSALAQSPGLHPVAQFGPPISGDDTPTQVVDDGLDLPLPAIEIWQVDSPTWFAQVYRAPDVRRVDGGTESLLTLADQGLLGNRPTVQSGDPEARQYQQAPLIETDTPQKREATVSQVRDVYSTVMTADQPYTTVRKEHDWIPFDAPEVTATYEGISGVAASSESGSTVGPWYAFDGDPITSWTSSIFAEGQWVEATFPHPVSLPRKIELTAGGGAQLATIQVTTDHGSVRSQLQPGDDLVGVRQDVLVDPAPTSKIRITVLKVWNGTELKPVSISDISIPGLTPARPLVVPKPASDSAPGAISLQDYRDGVDGCMFDNADLANDKGKNGPSGGLGAVCTPRLRAQSQDGTIDRILTMPAAGKYSLQATARLKASSQLDKYMAPPNPKAIHVTASSRWMPEPAMRPQAMDDRDPTTYWMAADNDQAPKIQLSWSGKRKIDRFKWEMDKGLAAASPAEIQVNTGGRTLTATPEQDGYWHFPAASTDRLTLIVTKWFPLVSKDRASGYPSFLPLGVSELVVPGVDDLRQPIPDWTPVQLPCGSGPNLVIGSTPVKTSVSGTVGDVEQRASMSVQPCGVSQISLPAGQVRLQMQQDPSWQPENMTLVSPTERADAAKLPPVTAPDGIWEDGPEHRVITVGSADVDQILVVHENLNAGWKATLDGRTLDPVRIDGWQQGYVVPAGLAGDVDLRFTPGPPYRIILVAGLLMVLLLAGFTLPPRRRRGTARRTAQRRVRLAEAVPLHEALHRRGYGVLGAVATVAMSGIWGVAALLGVLLAVRRRVPIRFLVIIGCVLSAIGAAFSVNSNETGFLATTAIAASIVLAACLSVRMDADSDRLLIRSTFLVWRRSVPPRTPGSGIGPVRPVKKLARQSPAPVPEPELEPESEAEPGAEAGAEAAPQAEPEKPTSQS